MNETINLRIKKLRKALDLTQQAFADRLGMKQNTIATYEMGKTTPSKPTIKSISREFGVNETWLRTGEGEMFIKSTAYDEISAKDKMQNETMFQRIKRARKVLDLTQQAFAERIGVKQNTIALIESGKRNTSDQLLLGVCREFKISETWLRTGKGEMFIKRTANDEISAFVDLALCDEPGNIRYRFLSALAAMSEEELQAAARFALALAK